MKLLPPPGPERRAQLVRLAVLLVLFALTVGLDRLLARAAAAPAR